ncbi:lipocalin-like domain-containing protein [Chondrinema litorale]|uniref:lipocalin-like domain-containing protein n=1 Tax=Chondrinema litorale TaxID=2994555 RepID=UPI0025427CDC|nr:lipocalin-like domain-containing protein [Chondrinema litorale]UZR97355.1 lipocalin-like domain-containing protein [Chondrinema litorale]
MLELVKEKVGARILGSWKLISWVYETEAGEEVDFYGNSPQGMLMYQDSGYMSVQIFKEERAPFKSVGLNTGTLEEKANSFASFSAYYGKFNEVEPGVFKHDVEGSLLPNWLGTTETRYAKIEDDILVLSTPPMETNDGTKIFKVTWRKVA